MTSTTTTKRRAIAAAAVAATFVAGVGTAHAAFGFDDVNEADTHAAGIQWLVDNGITAGCDADSYCPNDFVTRAQMATFMHRLSGDDQAASVFAANTDAVGQLTADQVLGARQIVTAEVTLTNDTFENVSVACPAGKAAIGGGIQVQVSNNGAISSDWYPVADRPSTDGLGWTASLRTLDDAAHSGFATVYAICAA